MARADLLTKDLEVPDVPRTGNTPFVRTDFSNEPAWRAVCDAIATETEEGFRAYVSIIDDVDFNGATATALAASAKTAGHGLLLLADDVTMSHQDHPILCIDLIPSERSIRVVPLALWEIENNLSLSNMDFEDFADSVDADGIFRGID